MFIYLIRRLNLFLITAFMLILAAFFLQIWVNGVEPESYLQSYSEYLLNILSGNWRVSILDQQPILVKGLNAFASTLELAVLAIIVSVIVAVPFGLYAGVYRNSKMDYLIMSVALIALSVPAFWVALIMTTLSNTTGLSLPIDGLISPIYDIPLITGFTLIDSLLAFDYINTMHL